MRCKVGDIAVIVYSNHSENVGAIVEVISASLVPSLDWMVRSKGRRLVGRPVLGYVAAGPIKTAMESNYRDSQLRPIRPQEGTDETLNWAERPREIA